VDSVTLTDEILTERRGSVLWVTFNRPQARNAMTFAMWERLAEIARGCNEDDELRAVVFRGAGGKAFVAGTDIAEFRNFQIAQDALDYETRMDRIIGAVEQIRVPTIAAINGFCTGGGASIAAACDLRIGSPSTRIGYPVARTLGNCLSLPNYARLVVLIGVARVKDLVFRARLADAQESLAAGLLNEVTPDEESVATRAEELATAIAANAPLTLRATKEALRRISKRLVPDDGSDIVLMCYLSEDFKEGVDAFLSKRPAQWKGK
jgi:enoyl-CoA hydratase/carnithine racemase